MREGWEYKKLGDVCDIYQPNTISTEMLVNNGKYYVYGANGIIGKYNEFNHENSEILLTCRGATCGTINISEPYSWINGNAMVIHRKSDSLNFDFLKYLMSSLDYSLIITGAAQPQITRAKLTPVKICIPQLSTQLSIVSELDKITEMISKYDEQLKELDKLSQSIFYEMFGDPIENEKGWEVKKIVEIADATIGLTYKPENVADNGVIVLRSGNIKNSALDFTDILRVETNIPSHKYVKDGDILMCTRNGSLRHVGKVAIIKNLNEQMTYGAFMTVIRSEMNPYLYGYFNTPAFRDSLIHGKTTTINQITVKMLNETSLPIPPLPLQQSFARKIEAIEAMKSKVREAKKEAETLLAARMHYWFE